ncbi:uncharacterized protein LOC123530017 [Mercenaria mercenaria]|uniref:uncharacterized protein LOC123530017 n=1 Tax=Mercenaria mercenaria TaxID=6596 RepID=UPI00234F05EC|nr:uncharacterized protein LOC123530017 [Mercenaria mercenaria]
MKFNKKVCEGVQVSKKWILTLSDCVNTKTLKKYKVVTYDGKERGIRSSESSTVKNMLVLLKMNANSNDEQDYPGIAGTDTANKYYKEARVYSPDGSDTFVSTSVSFVSDAKCTKQGTAERYNKKRHDCFTAEPVSITECSLKSGHPIFGVVKDEWRLLGFSISEIDICDGTYKQATIVEPHQSWVEEILAGK